MIEEVELLAEGKKDNVREKDGERGFSILFLGTIYHEENKGLAGSVAAPFFGITPIKL